MATYNAYRQHLRQITYTPIDRPWSRAAGQQANQLTTNNYNNNNKLATTRHYLV